MPEYLRKIRKVRWYNATWLSETELQADAFADLQTSNNNLSVWEIEDNHSNLDRIIEALAANCSFVSNFDFILFDSNIPEELKIDVHKTTGNSLNSEVNAAWHRDLIKLTASKLCGLAKKIHKNGKMTRISKKEVCNLISKAVKSGKIPKDKLKEMVLREIT